MLSEGDTIVDRGKVISLWTNDVDDVPVEYWAVTGIPGVVETTCRFNPDALIKAFTNAEVAAKE